MTEIIIRGVPIIFPFKPYKVQEDYMDKVLECLQQGVNGVLESPTGTGKTLSLLCSSLAWLQIKKAQLQVASQNLLMNNDTQQNFNSTLQSELEKSAGVTEQTNTVWSHILSPPQIIYASRTHSQLTQVIKELKRTSYAHVKGAVLGSRDQLCLHPDLAHEQGHLKNSMCHAKLSAKSCHYSNNLEVKKNDPTFMPQEVMDIEDLVKLGNKGQCCPYFMARELMNSADIVFMPYNYLLSPQTRIKQKLTLNNTVVILDEAHNVEKMCEESASVHISSTDIAVCIDEITQVMKQFSEEMKGDFNEDTNKDFSMEDLCVLKTTFLTLETAIDEIQLNMTTADLDREKKAGTSYPGSYIFELLGKAEIVKEKFPIIENALVNIAQYLTVTSQSAVSRKGGSLTHFCDFLKVVFDSCSETGTKQESDVSYKVYIEPEVPKKNKYDSWSSKKTVNTKGKVINFWCFSPGFGMRSLLRHGVHCVILTSGTLSPLHATISELGIPIPVQLENPHIIQPSQVCVATLSKGPSNEKLLSSYANRENAKYLSDLGRVLTNFCRVIPDGLLVFFPSYPMMEKTMTFWQEEGLWSQITVLKPLFVEPQRRESLLDVMRDFNEALSAEGTRGAVFLAVLRGKVSEGMDFADTRCRAVFVTGLPYPPLMDPRIMLKREYVDKQRKENPKGLTGNEWYELEALRAVNQAVGRVIRHGADFGAILLCDCRFESPRITNTLSAWLRPQISKCANFGAAYAKVSKFFKAMGLNPPVRLKQSGATFDYTDSKVRVKDVREEKTQKENNQESMQHFLEKFRPTQPKESQSSPAGLLDALSDTSVEKKQVDILRSVFNQPDDKVKEPYVQPAPKRRKLKIVPLQFDSNPELSSEVATTTSAYSRGHSRPSKQYLQEVKKRLNDTNFKLFSDSVKAYASKEDASYDRTVMCLRKVFPDATTKDLFIGFKSFIKEEHKPQFEELCFRMFGST